eukprot:CAMPEP_0119320980 /NCGR_PEP_ID=MMETSP1333-20130426/54050_1 /TAXON_ID=418940 /ORGANISM="Scyphosphaera apsteinii, Strain RCC1455" /LENGTH=124 /DNA_ID=CAMNT_0007327829 /DNA_START=426 /DNA_END=800 /DNA_ORIENTATION=+
MQQRPTRAAAVHGGVVYKPSSLQLWLERPLGLRHDLAHVGLETLRGAHAWLPDAKHLALICRGRVADPHIWVWATCRLLDPKKRKVVISAHPHTLCEHGHATRKGDTSHGADCLCHVACSKDEP